MAELPRLMFAAPASGGGKTTVTCAFLRLMQDRGREPCAFKCGPDYIDPMFHRSILNVDSRNLDLFFSTPHQVRALLARHGAGRGIAVMEGAMGCYDGVGSTDWSSSWHLARETKTPMVLVLQGGVGPLTLSAQVRGLAQFRTPSGIAGFLLNCCSREQYAALAPVLERETGLRGYGYLPRMQACSFSSRHLGLVTPEEGEAVAEKIAVLARQLGQTADVDGLLELAAQAPGLPDPPPLDRALPAQVRIGVARDRAFCFYYQDNLELLEQLGAKLLFFSPLEQRNLPRGIHGLYLGGGYPEVHARTLSENGAMREEVRRAAEDGMPVLAECGGFLYLQRTLEDESGRGWPMTGVLGGEGRNAGRHGHFGYITVTARRDTPFLKAGESIAAHEFHRWDVPDSGEACLARKPASRRSWPCIAAEGAVFAGFPHLYFPSQPEFPRRFVQACAGYKERT